MRSAVPGTRATLQQERSTEGSASVSPRGGELRQWADDQHQGFIALLTTADLAADALLIGSEAIQASADQLRAVGSEQQQWLESHPCPHQDLGDRLDALIERLSFMARSFEAPAGEYGDGYIPAVSHQLRILSAICRSSLRTLDTP